MTKKTYNISIYIYTHTHILTFNRKHVVSLLSFASVTCTGCVFSFCMLIFQFKFCDLSESPFCSAACLLALQMTEIYDHECYEQCTKSFVLTNILFSLIDMGVSLWFQCYFMQFMITSFNWMTEIFDVFSSVEVYLDHLWPRQLLSMIQVD